MKVNLTLGPRGPITRDKAKVCLMMNLGVPGSGSLMAGRVVGYLQLVLTAAGMMVSMIFAGKFITWFFANWSRLQNPSNDPMEMLGEIWQAVKGPLAGLALFGFAWLWGLASGLSILGKSKGEEQKLPPPLAR
jgi:hypothetical protein